MGERHPSLDGSRRCEPWFPSCNSNGPLWHRHLPPSFRILSCPMLLSVPSCLGGGADCAFWRSFWLLTYVFVHRYYGRLAANIATLLYATCRAIRFFIRVLYGTKFCSSLSRSYSFCFSVDCCSPPGWSARLSLAWFAFFSYIGRRILLVSSSCRPIVAPYTFVGGIS